MKKILYIICVIALTAYTVNAQYNCSSAVTITNGYTGGVVTTPGTNGTEDWVTAATTCGGLSSASYMTSADVYLYKYTTGATAGEAFTFTIDANVSFMGIGVYTSCSGTSLSGCVAGVSSTVAGDVSVCATGLAANTTYYIAVSRWGTPDVLNFSVTDFYVTTSSTRPADECASASIIDLSQPFRGSTSCSYTPSAGSPSGCGSIENDSWFKFVASSSDSVKIRYEVENCSDDFGVQFSVWSGTCGSLTQVSGSCINQTFETTGTWKFTGLTIGQTYYIRVDGYAGDICSYSFTPISGVAVTPSNDLCANAEVLACGARDTASIVLATATGAPTGCSGGGTPTKGVWYKFTGNGSNMVVSTNFTYTNFNTEINVYSGVCGALVCAGADDNSGANNTSVVTIATTNGTQYYIYVDGNATSQGDFIISLTCPGASCSANAGTWN